MPIDPKLAQSIDQVLKYLPDVIFDIQSRKDYAKNPAFAADISRLNDFKQQLMIVKDGPMPSSSTLAGIQGAVTNTILPMIESLISANLVMANMGQLNTNRTIEPKDAIDQNVKLASLQNALQGMLPYLPKAERKRIPPRVVGGKLLFKH